MPLQRCVGGLSIPWTPLSAFSHSACPPLPQVYMVMEYYENDLKHVLDNVPSKLLSEGDKKWLLHQLLLGIEYMHEKWYIHRDLKTSNLLISAKGGRLAIGDLGLARKYGEPLKPYTEVVVTPGYRCPELYLGQKLYSTAVDMWRYGFHVD